MRLLLSSWLKGYDVNCFSYVNPNSHGGLKALRYMLERAEELIDQGFITEAIQQLEDAYERVDGNPKPPDFASGNEASSLAELIKTLIDDLQNL
jgi:hypothetical protein